MRSYRTMRYSQNYAIFGQFSIFYKLPRDKEIPADEQMAYSSKNPDEHVVIEDNYENI